MLVDSQVPPSSDRGTALRDSSNSMSYVTKLGSSGRLDGAVYVQDPDYVQTYRMAMKNLQTVAMSPQQTFVVPEGLRQRRLGREAALSRLRWFKSSYSTNNGACVEVAFTPGTVLARDSKNPHAGRLAFSPTAWRALTARLAR
ncbi:hypothetical protein FHS29_002942 [Saccharothrix tamanrassetensis]|uniref:DUF397 domain-containing protein n=1 Tax=Saccharothrix tamanrassetensis TaxID=1051531 RepID=A0A841CL88_9PSEU|nr:DUF397 domain-containing protein [Saccharothrix tamanrassetensis]MBB5956356.1 hypothetical protein [Saccharothrix tamanrassetensis]